MFLKSDYVDWRNHALTQAFLKDLAQAYTAMANEIVERPDVNVPRDQYLKGVMSGLSLASGWKPVITTDDEEDGNPNKEEDDAD